MGENILGSAIHLIWSCCQHMFSANEPAQPQTPDFPNILKNDYEQVKVEAALLGVTLTLSSVTHFMLLHVNLLRYNTFISVLLYGMLIYFLVTLLAIFNYMMYMACIKMENMFLFYFCITACGLIMSACSAFCCVYLCVEAYKYIYNCESIPNRSPIKPMETLRNGVARAFRDKKKKLVESVKEKVRALMTSHTEVSYLGRVYAWFSSGKGVKTNRKKKGKMKKTK